MVAGWKGGIVAFGDRDVGEPLRQQSIADAERTAALVGDIFPGYRIKPVRGWPLADSTYPDGDIVYALCTPGIADLCDRRFVLEVPSELPAHVLEVAAGRAVALCAVHS